MMNRNTIWQRAVRRILHYRSHAGRLAGVGIGKGAPKMAQMAVSELGMLPALQGSPTIDINRNTLLALRAGRPAPSIVMEALRLMRGPGMLSAPEYFYFRLWEGDLTLK